MEAKPGKSCQIRTAAQDAFFDDTPEINVENHSLSPGWLMCIQTVFRNALALCQAARLSNLKAFDKKIIQIWDSAQLHQQSSSPQTESSGPPCQICSRNSGAWTMHCTR